MKMGFPALSCTKEISTPKRARGGNCIKTPCFHPNRIGLLSFMDGQSRLAALFPSAIGTPSQLGLEHFRKAYLLGASERRETSGAERNLGKSDREQEKVFVSNEARRGERTVFFVVCI